MKVAALLLSSVLVSATATPAIVWKGKVDQSGPVMHNSEATRPRDLIDDALNGPEEGMSLAAAVFLLGREPNGRDALSVLASSGSLPGISSNYGTAHSIHHNVLGVDNTNSMLREVRHGLTDDNPRVVQMSLSEFNRKLHEDPVETEVGTDGLILSTDAVIKNADVVVVDVASGTAAADIDISVVRAIEHGSIGRVVLTGIRGSEDVKEDRNLQAHHRFSQMKKASRHVALPGHRRLEDQGNAADDADQGDSDLSGIYYVHMTPNIFAGILFILFFTFVSFIGVTCMGMISNSDLYVSKVPSVGREA